MSCEYIYIYKGDDTDWNNNYVIRIWKNIQKVFG